MTRPANVETFELYPSVPEFARVPCWPVKEVNGFIFVWYHAEKEEPLWHVPDIPEIESKRWVYRGRTDYLVNAHIQVS